MTNREKRADFEAKLHNASLHCTPFRRISSRQLRWMRKHSCTFKSHGIDLPDDFDHVEDELMRQCQKFSAMASRTEHILEDVLYLAGRVTVKELMTIGRLCPNLQHLRITLLNHNEW